MNIKDKTALVLGSTKGIGKTIGMTVVDAGARGILPIMVCLEMCILDRSEGYISGRETDCRY